MKVRCVLALAAMAAVGCANLPPPVTPAAPEAKGVSIYFTAPKVEYTDSECAKFMDRLARDFRLSLAAEAKKAGYEVVADPTTPVQLVAEPKIFLPWCQMLSNSMVKGTASLLLKANGKLLGEIKGPADTVCNGGMCSWRDEPCANWNDEWGAACGRDVVNHMSNDEPFLAFARSRPARVPSVAPPPAAVAATPMASPSAALTRSSTATPIFLVAAPQPTAFAFIVGVEKYRDVPSATGARADAESFALLSRQTLGVPEGQIKLALDDRATRGDIVKHLHWLKGNAKPGGRIYFFFSGHGAPEPSSGTSYLLPYDGDPTALDESAITLTSVLRQLSDTGAKDVIAIVDSCFSGAGGRSVLPAGVRPLVMVKEPVIASHVALLAAATGAEISGATTNGSGGLFTHYVMEGIGTGEADINGDGQISLQEIFDWAKPRVTRDAKRDNRDQTPSMSIGQGGAAPGDFIIAWGVGKRP